MNTHTLAFDKTAWSGQRGLQLVDAISNAAATYGIIPESAEAGHDFFMYLAMCPLVYFPTNEAGSVELKHLQLSTTIKLSGKVFLCNFVVALNPELDRTSINFFSQDGLRFSVVAAAD